jgi:hypothetical protein
MFKSGEKMKDEEFVCSFCEKEQKYKSLTLYNICAKCYKREIDKIRKQAQEETEKRLLNAFKKVVLSYDDLLIGMKKELLDWIEEQLKEKQENENHKLI